MLCKDLFKTCPDLPGFRILTFNRIRIPVLIIPVVLTLFALPAEGRQHAGPEPILVIQPASHTVSPAGAMLRSFVLPGWGQLSLGGDYRGRGALHLGLEASLVTSYTWMHFNARSLENNMYTHVQRYAGIDISGRSRSFQLAVAANNSLAAHNDFMERSRQWNDILDDIPRNQWDWASEQNRLDYQQLRNRIDRNRQQLPAIATLMVANRIISGVHAFMSARQQSGSIPDLSLSMPRYGDDYAVQATLRIPF